MAETQRYVQLLRSDLSGGGYIHESGIDTPVRNIRFVIRGEGLPTIHEHEARLDAGVALGNLLVNTITPQILTNRQMREALVAPFFDGNGLNYIMRYISAHGVEQQSPPISRTDMLLTPEGPVAIEINPDAPEGYALTKAHRHMQLLQGGRRTGEDFSTMADYFHDAQVAYLERIRAQQGYVKAVIPFWREGQISPVDAQHMATDLRAKGFDVIAVPVDQLKQGNPDGVNCMLRVVAVGTDTWNRNRNLPLFSDNAWLQVPQYPAPWTDIAGLKHFFGMVYKMRQDPTLRNQFGISVQQLDYVLSVMQPTYAPPFHTIDEMTAIASAEPGQWVAKEIHSSHGEGFVDGDDLVSKLRTGRYTLQKKADCVRSGSLQILHPDDNLETVSGWLMDMDPMGRDRTGRMIAVVRVCPQHPMNVAGANGGGAFNPLVK